MIQCRNPSRSSGMGIHNKQSFTQEESFVKKNNGKVGANQGIGSKKTKGHIPII